MKDLILSELKQSHDVLTAFMQDERNIKAIENAAAIMIQCIKSGGKIIACGNGGSMSDAMHFASELTGRYRVDRDAIAAIAINDPAHLSCVANDYKYEEVFTRFVSAHAKPGDILLALSTSGHSRNVINAIHMMHCKQGVAVVITGNNDGPITQMIISGDACITIPHTGTADRIQEITIMIIHILVMLIEKGVLDE